MGTLLDLDTLPKPTTDERLRLDTRILFRKPRLWRRRKEEEAASRMERVGTLTWRANQTGRAIGKAEFGWRKRGPTDGVFVLRYWQDGANRTDRFRLVTTAIERRGRRWWVLCPLCDRRVAVLYSGPPFACWRCHGLAYASTRRASWARILSQLGL